MITGSWPPPTSVRQEESNDWEANCTEDETCVGTQQT